MTEIKRTEWQILGDEVYPDEKIAQPVDLYFKIAHELMDYFDGEEKACREATRLYFADGVSGTRDELRKLISSLNLARLGIDERPNCMYAFTLSELLKVQPSLDPVLSGAIEALEADIPEGGCMNQGCLNLEKCHNLSRFTLDVWMEIQKPKPARM